MSQMWRLSLFLPLAIFALVALMFFFNITGEGEGEPQTAPSALAPSRQVPDFHLTPLPDSGLEVFAKNDLRQGKIFVVNVWASWCAPCRVEHPLLMKLTQRKDIFLGGIAYKDAPKDAQRFLKRFGNPYDFLGLDQTGRAALGWGIYGVPETFVVDGAGNILLHHRGPITDIALITNLLDEVRQ